MNRTGKKLLELISIACGCIEKKKMVSLTGFMIKIPVNQALSFQHVCYGLYKGNCADTARD